MARRLSSIPQPGETRDCLDPWNTVLLHANGDVSLCCWSKPVGNLHGSTLPEILRNAQSKELRRTLLSGELVDDCRDCPARGLVSRGALKVKVEELERDAHNRAELRRWRAHAQVLEADLIEQRLHNATIAANLEQQKLHNATIQADLAQQKLHNATLAKELGSLRPHAVLLESDLAQEKRHNTTLALELAALRPHAATLEAELATLSKHAQTLAAERDALAKHAANLEAEKAALEKALGRGLLGQLRRWTAPLKRMLGSG
jgi:hypothetical protein